MEFRLLGPVEAWAGETRVRLGGGKPQALLAALPLGAGPADTNGHIITIAATTAPNGDMHLATVAPVTTRIEVPARSLAGTFAFLPPPGQEP